MPSVGKKVQIPLIDAALDYIYDAGLNPGLSTFWVGGSDLVMVEIDNTKGEKPVYLKLWDSDSGTQPVFAAAAPDMQFPCPALSTVAYPIVSKGVAGKPYFTHGIWYGVTTVPGTAGTSTDIPLEDTEPTIRMLTLLR
tara:strand:+ start:104 stop:517 length:414 start_codon:yes stop_codon:yes gene_type:complete